MYKQYRCVTTLRYPEEIENCDDPVTMDGVLALISRRGEEIVSITSYGPDLTSFLIIVKEPPATIQKRK